MEYISAMVMRLYMYFPLLSRQEPLKLELELTEFGGQSVHHW